jgi:hypothetical protein
MDSQKEKTELEQLLESAANPYDCTISTVSAIDTISLGDTIDLSGLTMAGSITSPSYTVSGASYAGPYTVNTGASAPWMTTSSTSAKISLNGEGADVEVNGWSLVTAVKRIEERLGLFQPNPELEQEWEELRALGEQYRQLEQHIKDKQATFDRLKAMPAPEVN